MKDKVLPTNEWTIIQCEESIQINGSVESPSGQLVLLGTVSKYDVCQLRLLLNKARDELKTRGINSMRIAFPSEFEVERIRKIVEIELGSDEIDSKIFVPSKPKGIQEGENFYYR